MTRRCGTRSAFVGGCRCQACRRSHSEYERERKRYGWDEKVAAAWTDPAPVVAHVQRLRAEGMGLRAIAEAAGVNRSTLDVILRGKHGYPATRMLRRNADAILAVRYRPLPGALVDPTGTRRRLQALSALGWPCHAIAERIGWQSSNLHAALVGKHGVTAATAEVVRRIYDDMSMTPGPSSRSRAHAARAGYAPPLAWDDEPGSPHHIDEPDATPALDADPADGCRVCHDVAELLEVDGSEPLAASRLGMSLASLEIHLRRHSSPLARRFGAASKREQIRRVAS